MSSEKAHQSLMAYALVSDGYLYSSRRIATYFLNQSTMICQQAEIVCFERSLHLLPTKAYNQLEKS
jgi:hypothetical protein